MIQRGNLFKTIPIVCSLTSLLVDQGKKRNKSTKSWLTRCQRIHENGTRQTLFWLLLGWWGRERL
uniref:Uncharacterized protein n=1 Tax=Rhizophora mucronata TaxID=61149 RepID=A0A2P2N8F3_RHIMU